MIKSCTLIADTRERHVIRHQSELGDINVETKQITTGDYVVISPAGAIIAIIERKSLVDFAASLKDGRHDNKRKLEELRNSTGCRIIYIIEGPEFPGPNDLFGNIPYRYIQSSIFHLMVRDCISVIRTKDTLHTARTLVQFVQSMNNLVRGNGQVMEMDVAQPHRDNIDLIIAAGNDSTVGIGDTTIVTPIEIAAELTKKHEKMDTDIIRELWACFPGISVESASEFMGKYSIADIICKRAQGIENFKLSSGRKISKKAANSLLRPDKLVEIRLLSTIPGISRRTALDILAERSLAQLLSYTPEVISICKVGNTKRNLGIEKANRLHTLFTNIYQ